MACANQNGLCQSKFALSTLTAAFKLFSVESHICSVTGCSWSVTCPGQTISAWKTVQLACQPKVVICTLWSQHSNLSFSAAYSWWEGPWYCQDFTLYCAFISWENLHLVIDEVCTDEVTAKSIWITSLEGMAEKQVISAADFTTPSPSKMKNLCLLIVKFVSLIDYQNQYLSTANWRTEYSLGFCWECSSIMWGWSRNCFLKLEID